MTDTKTILIIEPDDEIRTALINELRSQTPYKIITAKHGMEACSKIEKQKFNLILTEYNVPKRDGLAIISTARETKENVTTPIMLFSNDIEKPKLYTRAVRNLEFIQKPADLNFIILKMKQLLAQDPTKKKFRIDVDFINPFIDSAIETLKTMCKTEDLQHKETHLLEKDENLDIDISGVLDISCPYFKGTIAISFSNEVYEKLISSMLKEEKKADISLEDAASEMINIIYGKTKADLNGRGYSLNRAIPKVIKGKSHKITKSKAPILILPFNSKSGDFMIQISVKAT
jgi:CheY-specific phosphatase CheX/ActR/RegA family two-component response regulator